MKYSVFILVLQSSGRGRESWLLCRCIVTVNVLLVFLTVPWVGSQYVIVVFPEHTHLLFHTGLFAEIWIMGLLSCWVVAQYLSETGPTVAQLEVFFNSDSLCVESIFHCFITVC